MGFLVSLLVGRGLSALAAKAIIWGVIALVVGGTLLTIRQHYINEGWRKAIVAVKKQDDRAVAAADRVEEKVAKCDESSGFWDVITQDCRLQEEESK
jgi:hypothetical protein